MLLSFKIVSPYLQNRTAKDNKPIVYNYTIFRYSNPQPHIRGMFVNPQCQ